MRGEGWGWGSTETSMAWQIPSVCMALFGRLLKAKKGKKERKKKEISYPSVITTTYHQTNDGS